MGPLVYAEKANRLKNLYSILKDKKISKFGCLSLTYDIKIARIFFYFIITYYTKRNHVILKDDKT